MEKININPELCHDLLVQKTIPKYSFSESNDYSEWKNRIKEKFIELTGLDEIEKNACPLNVRVESDEQKEDYRLVRFVFDSEIGETVPCYLVIPDGTVGKRPIAITMQGHSPGFHNSVGIKLCKEDENYQPRGQFALQASKNGFIALAIEQRGMGERKPISKNRLYGINCQYNSRVALGLGRTTIGERVWDIHKAIDALAYFPECDTDKIIITGNSGGGTISYYAACYDERIKLSAPSCSFCPYKESILSIEHCACNYIPFCFKYFDMQDLACMIAPRKLIVIAGEKDDIFPIEGVYRGYETIEKIYAKAGALNNRSLVVTPREHWWCEDIVWKAITGAVKEMGWKL